MNILLTSAGRRVSLVRAFKNELRLLLPDGKVFAADMNPELSPACQVADKSFKVTPVSDPEYCTHLINICRNNDIKVIIPTIDTELIILSDNIDYFKENSILPVISDKLIVDKCRDKRKTFVLFDSLGFPRIMEVDRSNISFPVFVKPFNGSSSIGARLIRNESELPSSFLNDTDLMFVEYYDKRNFDEFTIDMFFDKNSSLKCAVPRRRIEIRSGEVSKSVTCKDNLYDLVIDRFAYCKGFRGCITLQVFKNKDTGHIFGFEINPRFGGGYPLSYFAGANYPQMIVREYLLYEDISFFDSWERNLLMLRYDDEIIIHDHKG